MKKNTRQKENSETIKKSLLPIYTEEEKKEIEQTVDDEYWGWTKDTQILYINYKVAQKKYEDNPNRWFIFYNKEGKKQMIDLFSINLKGLIINRGGSKEDISDAEEIKDKLVRPLLYQYKSAKQAFERAIVLEANQSYDRETKNKLLRLFGELNSISDIIKIMKEEEQYSFSQDELIRFYAKHKTEIENKRSAYIASSKEYKIANEAGRLQILNNILVDLNLKYNRYMTLGREDKALSFSREIRNILEQARKEIKGNDLKLTVDGKIDVVASLHGHQNIESDLRKLSINSIVIGIVAAKAGLNPAVIIHQLATSYYKDFNGFNKNILGTQDIMLPGDIIRGADWNELREKNKKFLNEMQPYQVEEATYQEVTTKESVKNRLEKLRKNI